MELSPSHKNNLLFESVSLANAGKKAVPHGRSPRRRLVVTCAGGQHTAASSVEFLLPGVTTPVLSLWLVAVRSSC